MSTIELDEHTAAQIAAVVAQVKRAEQEQRDAYALRKAVVKELHANGLRVGQIAPLVGVCAQRVSKILDDNAKPTLRKRKTPRAVVDGALTDD